MAPNNTVCDSRTSANTNLTIIPQLDRLVGLTMLIIATTVFLYYTVWTLLMVRTRVSLPNDNRLANVPLSLAFRRRLAPHPVPLPSSRLGHTDTSHPPSSRRRCCGQLPKHCHDQE